MLSAPQFIAVWLHKTQHKGDKNEMNILDYLTGHITDDQLIQAVSEYINLEIPAQDIKADKRLLNAIFVIPLIEDCYTSHRAHTMHRKDCVISLVCNSLYRHTEKHRSV